MQRHSTLSLSRPLLARPEEIISVYRGWDAFERIYEGQKIIDFDLTPIDATASFSSRKEILAALKALWEQLNDNSPEEEFLRAKLQGSIFYLRALMGHAIPFDEYIRHTLGILPERFSDQEIEAARSKVNDLLSYFGLQLKEQCKEDFETQFFIRDPAEIERGILDNQALWLSRLYKKGIPFPEKFELHVEFTKKDVYWSNWISGSFTKGILLQINLHPRKKYDRGKPLALCLHEICGHAVQMAIWKRWISEGKINHACGVTTVHSPEAFVAEGLGQTVADFLGDENDLPREFQLSRWLHYFTLLILHNAHLMIYEGVPIEEILHYAHKNLPFSSPSTIKAEIRDRSTNPLYRTYQLSYAAAEYTIKNLIQNFSPQQKRKFFFGMYTRPMTPKQLYKFAQEIKD